MNKGAASGWRVALGILVPKSGDCYSAAINYIIENYPKSLNLELGDKFEIIASQAQLINTEKHLKALGFSEPHDFEVRRTHFANAPEPDHATGVGERLKPHGDNLSELRAVRDKLINELEVSSKP